MASIMREDWVYIDDEGLRISLTRHEGYKTFSEKFRDHFGERYACDRLGAICTGKNGKALNLKAIKSMLVSTDRSEYDKLKWIFDGEFRFLDLQPTETKIAFLSYPRSGNSLMRRVLEKSMGIATGSTGSLHTGTYL